jgi:hypothetical protein
MDKERHVEVQNLKKYPEFYALKVELEAFCDRLDSLEDFRINHDKNISIEAEVYGRVWARDKVRDFLSSLGLVDKTRGKIVDKTGE